jgi:hypothetical protein
MAEPIVVGFDGTVDEVAWASLTSYMGAEYAVQDENALAVSPVAGMDRTVSIAPGQGFNHGVTATFTEPMTVQLPIPTSGTRWDLIVLRFDWQPPGGTVVPTYVQGTPTRAVPAGRLAEPGVADDLPLALVQVSSTSPTPTAVIDLRVWTGNGGMFAWDVLALSFLTRLGSRVLIGPDEWVRTLDAVDNPVWTSARLSRPMVRAWRTPRVSGSPVDSYVPSQRDVSLVFMSQDHMPAGWYTFTPQLAVGLQGSGTTVGYLTLTVNGSDRHQARADLDGVTRTISPTFASYHPGGTLTANLAHRISSGTAVIDNALSGLLAVYVGP